MAICWTDDRMPEPEDRESVLRQQIERLKKDRAAICLSKTGPAGEGKLSPDTGQSAGSRQGHVTKDNPKPPDSKKEKASLFHELISVRVGAVCLCQKKSIW